jgi:hypothetical protein
MARRRQRVLRWAAVAGAAVAATLPHLVGGKPVAAVCAILLVLVLPGAVATTWALPPRRQSTLVEQLFWAVALSIISSIGLGLLLDAIVGYYQWTWEVALAGWTGLLAVVGELLDLRRHHRGLDTEFVPVAPRVTRDRRSLIVSTLLFGTAAVIVAAAFVMTQHNIGSTDNKFVQLWILPNPYSAGSHAQDAVVGVANYETSSVHVSLVVSSAGESPNHWTFDLSPGKSWEKPVVRNASQRTTATISYDVGGHTIVRSVNLAGALA